jgi:hypothetical protein
MDINNVVQSASEVALSIDQITGWILKIVGALSAVIICLATVVAFLFKMLIAEQKKWSETQLTMQKETNQVINDNTNALKSLSEGIKSIPDHIETVLKLHLIEKK